MDKESDNIKDKILKEIEKKHICPTPRWCFCCRNFSLWALAVFFWFVAILSISLMIFLFFSHDWDAWQLESKSLLGHILVYTPYLWIVIFLLSVLLLRYIVSRTEEGYRYENKKIISVGILIVMVLALISTATGLSPAFHENLEKKLSLYRFIIFDKDDMWDNPSRGLLSGEVVSINETGDFQVKGYDDVLWQVKGSESAIMVPESFKLQTGKKIKMIGRAFDSNIFVASEIKPW